MFKILALLLKTPFQKVIQFKKKSIDKGGYQ